MDLCSNGKCSLIPISNCCASASDCNDGDKCTTDICQQSGNTFSCFNIKINNCCATNLDCSDGKANTQDLCISGKCSNLFITNYCSSASQCNDGNSCTTDSCVSNLCKHDSISGCSNTCTANCAGKECGADGCGGTCSPGCSSGFTCSNNQCVTSGSSSPSCTDGIKNQGETAIDCGGPNCQACGVNPTCTDGILNGAETGIDCGGTCDACASPTDCGNGVCEKGEQQYDANGLNPNYCSADCPIDPPIKGITITNVRVANADGDKVTSNTTLQPGQTLTVKFTVNVPYADFAARFCSNALECLDNVWTGGLIYDSNKEYNIETGIIPASVAKAWFGEKEPGTFSIFNLFAAKGKSDVSSCCEVGQPNILADRTTFTKTLVGKTWDSLDGDVKDYATSEHTIQIQVPNKDTENMCMMVNEGASDANPSSYWDPSSEYYILYIDIKNGCYSENGIFQGHTNAVDKLYETRLDINGTGTSAGTICKDNADCSVGETCTDCSKLGDKCTFWEKSIGGTKKCAGSQEFNQSYTKFPLTKDEIKAGRTSGDLLASACYYSTDCSGRVNYTASCVPVATLVTEGTMTVQGEKDLFSSGKSMLATGLIGGGAGAAFCLIGYGLGPVSLGATTLVGCGIAGAIALVGVTELGSQGVIGVGNLFSNELKDAINKGDSTKVGICIAEPNQVPFDLGGMLCKVGKFIKITNDCTVDGLIIIIGGFLILMFIVNSSKKGGQR
jgi:hypothetical protein